MMFPFKNIYSIEPGCNFNFKLKILILKRQIILKGNNY